MAGLAGSRRYVVRHVQLDPIRGTGEFDRVGSPNPRAMPSELDLRLERLARSTLIANRPDRPDRSRRSPGATPPHLRESRAPRSIRAATSFSRAAASAASVSGRPASVRARIAALAGRVRSSASLTARKATRPSSEPIKSSAGRVLRPRSSGSAADKSSNSRLRTASPVLCGCGEDDPFAQRHTASPRLGRGGAT